jgi:L-alanine-DL-glutamate epimerase and related enzymes of enolase superfamily
MSKRNLKVYSENWDEEPFAISRSRSDNFSIVIVELEQNGFKGWGECTPTERYNESIEQKVSLIENYRKNMKKEF